MSKELDEDSKTGCGCLVVLFILAVIAGIIEPTTLLVVILAFVILALL